MSAHKVNWRDAETSSGAIIELPDGTSHWLTIHAPNDYSDVWTAQAEHIAADFRQLSFSGLFNGGLTRDTAKAVALVALREV